MSSESTYPHNWRCVSAKSHPSVEVTCDKTNVLRMSASWILGNFSF